jgi:hypothetical protein
VTARSSPRLRRRRLLPSSAPPPRVLASSSPLPASPASAGGSAPPRLLTPRPAFGRHLHPLPSAAPPRLLTPRLHRRCPASSRFACPILHWGPCTGGKGVKRRQGRLESRFCGSTSPMEVVRGSTDSSMAGAVPLHPVWQGSAGAVPNSPLKGI